jgi:sirohydrochlorin ferrochelatase
MESPDWTRTGEVWSRGIELDERVAHAVSRAVEKHPDEIEVLRMDPDDTATYAWWRKQVTAARAEFADRSDAAVYRLHLRSVGWSDPDRNLQRYRLCLVRVTRQRQDTTA